MIHFIVNPRAGSSRGIRTFRKLEPQLIRYHLSYDVMFTQYPGHATAEATRLRLSETAPQIAVLGGDGTMHEVLEGLRAARFADDTQEDVSRANMPVTLMFLPCGSGNDFARGLRLTRDPAKFAQALMLSPAKIRLHYGCGHTQGVSQGFFVSGGMGFDSSVTEEINMSPLKNIANRLHLSTLAYLLLGVRQILVEPQAPARIVVDDSRLLKTDRLFFLSAHKVRCEGGGFPFAPDASPASDTLSVCIFYGMNRVSCAWALFLSLFGLHRYKRGVALLNCKKVEIFSQTFRSAHTDGEPLGFADHVCFTAGEGDCGTGQTASSVFADSGNSMHSPCAEMSSDIPIDFLVTAQK